MATREFEIERGALVKIEAAAGDRLRVHLGDVWVTQHEDSKDYVLRSGESMILSGKGAALAMAYKRTLLSWHHDDPRPQARARPQWALALLRKILA
jgi:hypothetical protein